MFLFSRISLLRLMNLMKRMKAWSQQFLFSLTTSTFGCFYIIVKSWCLLSFLFHKLWRIFVLESTISRPNGVKANPAILKCCFPKGIPMMVMNSKMPNKTWVNQIQIPPKKNQIIFMIVLRQLGWPSDGRTREPNGQIQKIPIFNVCKPKGIPIIVIISPRLAIKYSIAVSAPPKINQIIFPITFILCLPFVMRQIYRLFDEYNRF